jgi:hypothetical protein
MVDVRSELIAAVERSPEAAAAHDRAGWVGLFASDGRIEDPVGSYPHIGIDQIGRFFDTFIAPRRIVFHRDLDIVSDTTVVRDLLLEVGMGSSVTMNIPAMLRYDLAPAADGWRIQRLRAYWELPAMMLRFLGSGLAAAPQAFQLTRGLARNQGLSGSAGFAAGFRGARWRGKRTVRTFLEALAAGDQLAGWRCLAPGATITRGERKPVKFSTFGEEMADVRWPKIIAAGSVVAASVRGSSNGVLFADTAQRGRVIRRLTYFAD